MPHHLHRDRLLTVLAAVDELMLDVAASEHRHAEAIGAVPATQRSSARNLAHYLAVRAHDLRPLQAELRALALSSLGRMEGNVLHTLQGVRRALQALLGEPGESDAAANADALGSDEGDRRLSRHTANLLGEAAPERTTRIMVTLPSAAAADRELLRALLGAGMEIARINLAHDGPDQWTAMVDHLRSAAHELGRTCRILVDLPGPKLRTGPLPPGPRVLRARPRRDELGRCIEPIAVEFVDTDNAAAPDSGKLAIPLATPLAHLAAPGDELVVIDTRGRVRRGRVIAATTDRCTTTFDRTAYLGTDCRVTLRRGRIELGASRLGELPALPAHLLLQVGDTLMVTRDALPGGPAVALGEGRIEPAHIGCTLAQVFDDARAGQRILFDDGKIAGIVQQNDGARLQVLTTSVPPGGGKLRAEKGINLPDTELHTPALTPFDLGCLDWVAQHADLVGMSFAQRAADVLQLEAELGRRGRADLGVMLKIETARGFERLPELLFAGLRNPPLGVMVARGDLAVEVGFARLAEVQEEILWLCEAAHVPVVWATQVLDGMARSGVPTRAEVTDAAMGGRAECVMLNKGPYITATVQFLASVLTRMQDHTTKKRSLLRALRIANGPRHADGA